MPPIEPQVPQEPTGEEQILEHIFESTVRSNDEASTQRDNLLQATASVNETLKGMEPLMELSLKAQVDTKNALKESFSETTNVLRETSKILEKQGQDIQDGAQIIIKGIKGDKGDRGEKGDSIVGEKGAKGDKGDRGEDGKDGAQGQKGDKGDKGESIVGPQGLEGKQGARGAKGDKGDIGKTPDVSKFIEELRGEIAKDIDQRAETLRKVSSRDYDLTELKDVTITSPTTNQVLKYDGTKWVNGSGGGGGGGHTIQDEGVSLTQRTNLNFVGAGVTATDGGAGPDSTIITIPGGVASTRAINTTAPLSGGGDLSADRTITTSMATNKLIGRATAGSGVMEEITLGSNLSFSGTTLNASGGGTITTQEEGVDLSTTVTTLNFVGAGVTASGAGATTTITIPGGGTATTDYTTPFMFMGA